MTSNGDFQPVYVFCPPWRGTSAGIQVLHRLCDAINSAGHPSWTLLSNPHASSPIRTDLNSPVASSRLLQQHRDAGADPIVVYSETVPGNLLKARRVARYLLNYPGALASAKSFATGELAFAYSASISASVGGIPTLFIPAVDMNELSLYTSGKSTGGLPVVYAAKYRAFAGVPDLSWVGEHVEIHRSGRSRQDRAEVLRLLRKAPVVYCFENSTIATEAILLGTPVIFVRSPFLQEVIAAQELGPYGWAWHDDPGGFAYAAETVGMAAEVYQRACDTLPERTAEFLPTLLSAAHLYTGPQQLRAPRGSLLFRHRLRLGVQTYKHLGLAGLARVTRDFLGRDNE